MSAYIYCSPNLLPPFPRLLHSTDGPRLNWQWHTAIYTMLLLVPCAPFSYPLGTSISLLFFVRGTARRLFLVFMYLVSCMIIPVRDEKARKKITLRQRGILEVGYTVTSAEQNYYFLFATQMEFKEPGGFSPLSQQVQVSKSIECVSESNIPLTRLLWTKTRALSVSVRILAM
ncbi:hypothetical protein R3P38DRAFT_1374191 [Favolaschia claudopus]|uniref:Uncharacterized protein n=1 Tax=Favolaschia claudopus TaxID=2862362 RepID=A0AAW0DX01_9AGAR